MDLSWSQTPSSVWWALENASTASISTESSRSHVQQQRRRKKRPTTRKKRSEQAVSVLNFYDYADADQVEESEEALDAWTKEHNDRGVIRVYQPGKNSARWVGWVELVVSNMYTHYSDTHYSDTHYSDTHSSTQNSHKYKHIHSTHTTQLMHHAYRIHIQTHTLKNSHSRTHTHIHDCRFHLFGAGEVYTGNGRRGDYGSLSGKGAPDTLRQWLSEKGTQR